jgi:hypothetical protein
MTPPTVTITGQRCPRAGHRSDKNIHLRERPDGSRFCPVHGEVEMPRCGDLNIGGDGVTRQCDKPVGHRGWHGETVELRGSGDDTYRSTTNWGDDGKGIHASRGMRNAHGRLEVPA